MNNETSKKPLDDQQPSIIWDDSNMRSVYANVANVLGGMTAWKAAGLATVK